MFPDPPFQAKYQSGSSSGLESRSGAFMNKNVKKITDVNFLSIIWIKKCNLLIPRPPERTSNLQGLQPSKRAPSRCFKT
jgi:hypothetical protein